MEANSVQGRFQASPRLSVQTRGKSEPNSAALLAKVQYSQEVEYSVGDLETKDRPTQIRGNNDENVDRSQFYWNWLYPPGKTGFL